MQIKITVLQASIRPIADTGIAHYLKGGELDLQLTSDASAGYAEADFVAVTTPTDYDPRTNYFDTSPVEASNRSSICSESGCRGCHQVNRPS